MTRVADRVKETCSTTGIGSVTLGGAVAGYRAFLATLGAGAVYYTIAHQTLAEWEVGIGTLTTGPDTLARTTVLASSNAGALTNFSIGTKDVFCTIPAAAIGPTSPFTKEFISSAQAMTSGTTLTLAHGFGSIPKLVQHRTKCTTAEAGWSVGDELVYGPNTDYFNQGAGASAANLTTMLDATNVTVVIGASGLIGTNKTTRVIVNLTAANWQLYVRAWA